MQNLKIKRNKLDYRGNPTAEQQTNKSTDVQWESQRHYFKWSSREHAHMYLSLHS